MRGRGGAPVSDFFYYGSKFKIKKNKEKFEVGGITMH